MVSNEPRHQWYHEDLPRFRDALTFTEAESGFSSRLIEKDYICTLILQDLSLHFGTPPRSSLFDHRTDEVLNLVAAKLSIAENDPVDLSETKLALLRGQLKMQLQPVLRTVDFQAFDLERAFGTLQQIMQLLRSR